MTQVLQDEMSLRNAYTACLDALYQYKCARLALLRLTGHLDELNDQYRFIFCLSFLLMAVANILLYFSFQSEILLSQIALAIVLMNMGLLPLYALVAAYGMHGLPNHLLASLVFVMIFFRNAVAPPVGSALYANWLYHRQQYHEQRLSENLDPTLLASPTQLTARYRQVVVQSHLAAMKDVAGMTVWAVIGLGEAMVVVPVERRKKN